jgi:glycosyltransferase involved in cell wall biosynthesis
MSTQNADTDGRLQILVVADASPWPTVSGYQRRLATVIDALCTVASVDLWTADLGGDAAHRVDPASAAVRRHHWSDRVRRRGLAARALRWCTSTLPRGQVEFDAHDARSDLIAWAEPEYDLIWCAHLRTFLWTAGAATGPRVLDLDDVADALLAHRRKMLRLTNDGQRRSVRALAAQLADGIDERRYRRLHRRVARDVGVVAVCSELDRGRLHVENAVVVPNTYPSPEPPATLHDPDASAPRFAMVGLLAYGPNCDGARFFVREVFPQVRAALPGARLRLVGRHGGLIDDLAAVAGVELVGEVSDIDAELRAADVVVVPVRYGGGTRVKLLEAFAYRVPAVSTTVGCEGLDADHGRHLLVADEPEALAAACISVVRDGALRSTLTDSAFALYEDRFRPEVAKRAVASIIQSVTSKSAGSASSRS